MRKVLGVALAVASIFVTVMSSSLIYGLLVTSITLTNTGTVKTNGVGETADLGAYWDITCTSEVSTINWGTIEAGLTKKIVIFLKNNGDTPLTLSLDTDNWSPSVASSYMSLDWSYSGGELRPGNVIQVTLSLTVSSSISGVSNFAFDIVITGTG